jgi:mRNA interferase RelE/StbE
MKWSVKDEILIVTVIAFGKRERGDVYKEAAKR